MPLPGQVSTGTVTGQILDLEGDPAPDAIVQFTPVPDVLAVEAAGVIIMPAPISATTDSDGVLVDKTGTPDVELIATTDADVLPLNWTWWCTIKWPTTSPRYKPRSFAFTLASGAAVDLSEIVPTVPSGGEDPGTGQDGASAYEVAVSNGFVGTEPEWLASLVGEDGAPGEVTTAALNAAIAGVTTASIGAIPQASGVVAVQAGNDLATARPAGAGIAYWVFDDPAVVPGAAGENIINAVAGDMWFVPDA